MAKPEKQVDAMPAASVIIRTKNEEKWLGECLTRLAGQTYRDFETVIVDSGSTDRTLDIARQFPVRVLNIRSEEFSYPYALNYGCGRANAERYFVFLSGHSLPQNRMWLADGISNFFDDRVMGAYGFVWALPDGSIWERAIFNKCVSRLRHRFHKQQRIGTWGMGVLGFTNAVIRRDLWEQHYFDEAYGLGGEDGEWSRYWFRRGYIAVRDIRFSVYHSHGLGLRALQQQWRHWASMGRPQPFRPPEFRKKHH